jgi:hypothetical protein
VSPDSSLRTVNDWITGVLQNRFRSGDIFNRNGLRVAIRKVRRHKVFEAQIGRLDEGEKTAGK